jgi:hypothetical protein
MYKSSVAPEVSRYHIDMLIPDANGPILVKICNLSYPIMF